jgi:hypothetical protein
LTATPNFAEIVKDAFFVWTLMQRASIDRELF